MSNKFAKIAMETTSLCPLMVGKEKLSTKDVINNEYTVIGFDFASAVNKKTGELKEFGVVVFKEEPKKYYCVGTIFTKVCRAWMSGYDTPHDASIDLEKEGGVRVKFWPGKTKDGNELVSVDILD